MDKNKVKQYLRNTLDAKIDNKKDDLLQQVDQLKSRMTRLAAAVLQDESFNTLGEIQGLGSEIDRLTGELALLKKMRAEIGSMLDEAIIMADVF